LPIYNNKVPDCIKNGIVDEENINYPEYITICMYKVKSKSYTLVTYINTKDKNGWRPKE